MFELRSDVKISISKEEMWTRIEKYGCNPSTVFIDNNQYREEVEYHLNFWTDSSGIKQILEKLGAWELFRPIGRGHLLHIVPHHNKLLDWHGKRNQEELENENQIWALRRDYEDFDYKWSSAALQKRAFNSIIHFRKPWLRV